MIHAALRIQYDTQFISMKHAQKKSLDLDDNTM